MLVDFKGSRLGSGSGSRGDLGDPRTEGCGALRSLGVQAARERTRTNSVVGLYLVVEGDQPFPLRTGAQFLRCAEVDLERFPHSSSTLRAWGRSQRRTAGRPGHPGRFLFGGSDGGPLPTRAVHGGLRLGTVPSARGRTMKAIEVIGLEKKYGRTTAVERLSFDVEPGEVVGLLGPNGSGKTTLLRMLATLLKPTSGHARVMDLDGRFHAAKIRRILGF